ncbi:MAG: GGDEF domain-containing protein [Ruminococcus sp.]|nr:GGDEF domain-containing protein [Ruminococcus sp.]
MIIGYAVIVIGAIALVARFALAKTDEVLSNKVISLTSSLNVQMKLNMDSYLSRMETIATLAFAEEKAYTYDASDPKNDEYEAINTEKVISDKLYSLCIMENFVDYGIVYRNNRTVGKISNATSSQFGDRIFTELSSMISRPRTNDGWATGYDNDFRRIYYVKKVHDNAVLFISFYSTELDTVFDNPETLSDMEIRLVNSNYDILYSEDSAEVGKPLPDNIKNRIAGRNSASVLDSEYLVSVNSCRDWFVVCSIPTQIILNEKNDMTWFIVMTAILAAAAAVIVGLMLSYRLTEPIKRIVLTLDDKASIDLLTGVLNKLTFEDYATGCLERSLKNERHALFIIDIDNFKDVNDRLGHAFGDKVLKETGSILRSTFSEDDYLGRIGGDEFAVLVNKRFGSEESFSAYVKEKCTELTETYHKTFSGEDGSHKVTVSVGVSVSPENGRSFEELYAACDKALYRSKHEGRDRFSVYEPSMESEGEA